MKTLTYQEVEAALERIEPGTTLSEDPNDKPGHWIEYLLGEMKTKEVLDFMKTQDFIYSDETQTITFDPEKLPSIKEMANNIDEAKDKWYASRNKKVSNKAGAFLAKWGLDSFDMSNGRRYISNDMLEYCSTYVLDIVKGVECCLQSA